MIPAIFFSGPLNLAFFFMTVGVIAFLLAAIERESLIGCSINIFLLLCFLQWFYHVNIIGWSLDHPIKLFLYILGYLIVGVLWSFVKWWFKITKNVDNYKKERARIRFLFLEKRLPKEIITVNTPMPEALLQDWEKHKSCYNYVPEKASDNKNLIATWITYWPLSLLWSLIHDFVKQFIKKIITTFQGIYDNITRKAEKDL